MKFDLRRLTPAFLTSLGLMVLALLLASVGWVVVAWLVGVLGAALGVMAVTVTEIDESWGAPRSSASDDPTQAAAADPRTASQRPTVREASAAEAEHSRAPSPAGSTAVAEPERRSGSSRAA